MAVTGKMVTEQLWAEEAPIVDRDQSNCNSIRALIHLSQCDSTVLSSERNQTLSQASCKPNLCWHLHKNASASWNARREALTKSFALGRVWMAEKHANLFRRIPRSDLAFRDWWRTMRRRRRKYYSHLIRIKCKSCSLAASFQNNIQMKCLLTLNSRDRRGTHFSFFFVSWWRARGGEC